MSAVANEKKPDADTLREAIGRETRSSDVVNLARCQQLEATLDRGVDKVAVGDPAPLGIHWCVNLACAPMAQIDTDGHPKRGQFLPDVPLPRRMWAGGQLRLLDPILVGDRVDQTSIITDVRVKEGRSGTLCFITVEHTISTERGVAIREKQDIVYRGQTSTPKPASISEEVAKSATIRKAVTANPVLLFRYSALTFNAHRIHYDRDYAQLEEGYPGLVVHGPLQATQLLNLAASYKCMPKTFHFRGVSPLFDGSEYTLNAEPTDAGLDLWTSSAAGHDAMLAKAEWS
ncbi:FAS1-like dehydratase domain-containing protein [Granulosicoccus antarcticus]|uniref:Mesaconyl-C(4)-CoA hydratase n=1 Tax=Granulosicoccus antarcticus IMCC3135 TaxID=1192854 RepID=A0A2Z2NTT8_9GAMM|nr:MaoC family dehydratase N-terminal domain-containing protein [Granulosicoccus antarcticus]ASJ73461.1 Mesaconyl-C(4)-CoA hydratase [Granulosicoccus antarcticus IMCC3135]